MKRNQNDPRQPGYTGERSSQKSFGDYDFLEPSPDMDLNDLEDEDDYTSDYSLMSDTNTIDYEE